MPSTLIVDAFAIACGAGRHRVAISGAEFALLDHDVESELAMVALGGRLPECLLYLAVWESALADPLFLRSWGDDVDDEARRGAREEWEGNYWESWPAEPHAGRTLFGPALQRRLALAAAARAARTGRADLDTVAALGRATANRARRAFVASLAEVDAHPRPDALIPVRIDLVAPGSAGAISGRLARHDSIVRISLPADWLLTTWAVVTRPARAAFVLSTGGGVTREVQWRATGRPGREHVPVLVEFPTANRR